MISPRKPHLLAALVASASLQLTVALALLFASAGGGAGTGGHGFASPASRTIHVALDGAPGDTEGTAGEETPSAARDTESRPVPIDETLPPAADEDAPEPEQADETLLTELAEESDPAPTYPAEMPPEPAAADAREYPKPPESKPRPPRPAAQPATAKRIAAPLPKRKPPQRAIRTARRTDATVKPASRDATVKPASRDADAPASDRSAPSPSRESHGGASAGLQAPVATSGDSGAAGSSGPVSPGSGIGMRPDYIASLRAWLEEHKEYPRRARLRQQEGVVLLSFSLDRGGNLLSWRIARSSGHPTLDAAASDLIQRASPMPKIPRSFKSDRLDLSIPIHFQLK